MLSFCLVARLNEAKDALHRIAGLPTHMLIEEAAADIEIRVEPSW